MIIKKLTPQRSWLCLAGGALTMMGTSMSLHAGQFEDFARSETFGDGIVWEVHKPPADAERVILRVLHTPNEMGADSYVDKRTYGISEKIVYPFEAGDLPDGSYTWELRLVSKGDLIGFTGKREEGEIDKNGREVELLPEKKPRDTKEREWISNKGFDSIQTGGFRVVRGEIPKEQQEESGK